MNSVGGLAIALAAGYLCGSIPWGFLIGKSNGIDLRQHGSGNIGATNVRRILGKRWGALCFILDVLKGLLPVLAVTAWLSAGAESEGLLPVLTAGATVAGHVWPFSLRFKGGKGVATTIGALCALAPWSVLAALVTWLLVFYALRYVSLASVLAAVILPLSALVERALNGAEPTTPVLILLLLLAMLILVRHKSNLKRMLAGDEYRFERKEAE